MVAPSPSWPVLESAISMRRPSADSVTQVLHVEGDKLGAAEGASKPEQQVFAIPLARKLSGQLRTMALDATALLSVGVGSPASLWAYLIAATRRLWPRVEALLSRPASCAR